MSYYRTDKVTEPQLAQARDLTGSSLFSPEERRRWLLEITMMDRFQARDAIQRLAAEWRKRNAEQRDDAA